MLKKNGVPMPANSRAPVSILFACRSSHWSMGEMGIIIRRASRMMSMVGFASKLG